MFPTPNKPLPLIIILLLILLLITTTAAASTPTNPNQSPGGTTGLGPGGVGTTDGTSNLKAWWAADKDTYLDDACTIPAVQNDRVNCWLDQSGSGRHATQQIHPAASPVYKSAYLNNLPVLYGTTGSYNTALSFDGTFLAGSDYTVFAVEGRINGLAHSYYMGGSGTWGAALVLGYYSDDTLFLSHFGDELFAPVPAFVSQQFTIQGYSLDQTIGREIFYQGKSIASDTHTTPLTSFNGATIFRSPSSAKTFRGDIAEIIIYDRALNGIERMMVENYLSSKYGVDLDTAGGAIDLFDGDLTINGDFDFDMAGILNVGGNQLTEAHSAGIIVRDIDFLQDDGDWLTFAHRDPIPGNTTADLPTTGDWSTAPDPRRWLRHWYFDRTDAPGTTGGTVDLIFDLDKGQMNNAGYPPTGPVSNYRLLGRSDATGDFTDITAASGAVVALNGGQIQFLGVDVAILGSNFTVGTLNYTLSPTALTLANINVTGDTPLEIIPLVLLLLALSLSAIILRERR